MDQILINNVGDVLLELEKVSRVDLDRAIEVQRQTGQKLGRMLIDLGTISEEDLRLAYSKLLQIPIWEKKKDDQYPSSKTCQRYSSLPTVSFPCAFTTAPLTLPLPTRLISC